MLLPYIRMIFWYMIILISVSWITDWMMMSLRPRPPLVTERRQMYLMKAGRYIFVLGIEPTSLFHVTPKRHNSVFSSFTHITSWWNFPSVLVNPRTWSTYGVEIVRCQYCLHCNGRSRCTKISKYRTRYHSDPYVKQHQKCLDLE